MEKPGTPKRQREQTGGSACSLKGQGRGGPAGQRLLDKTAPNIPGKWQSKDDSQEESSGGALSARSGGAGPSLPSTDWDTGALAVAPAAPLGTPQFSIPPELDVRTQDITNEGSMRHQSCTQ